MVRNDSPRSTKYTGLAIYAVCGMVLLFVGYVVFTKQSLVRPETNASVAATVDTNSGAIAVAVPAQELGVTAPRLEGFDKLLHDEIIDQNSARGVNTSMAGTTSLEETMRDREAEINDRLGARCKGGGGFPEECNNRLNGIKADIAARQHNEMMANLKFCPPKIDGPITIAEPGRYHQFGDDIFYSGKIKANGFSGIEENGVCAVSKTAIIPLTAQVYLKWSGKSGATGWQASSKGVFTSTSMRYHKESAEKKKEEREKARAEQWREQNREAYNKRLQEKAFRALNK